MNGIKHCFTERIETSAEKFMRHVITLKFSLVERNFQVLRKRYQKVLIPKRVTNVADAVYLPCYQAQDLVKKVICVGVWKKAHSHLVSCKLLVLVLVTE